MQGRLNPFLTFLFASLILLFTGGPVVLSLVGSLVPDRILLDRSKSLFERRAELRDLSLRLHRPAAGFLPRRRTPTAR